MRRSLLWWLPVTALASQSACEMVLGFEDHELGSFDGGAGGLMAGGAAGDGTGGTTAAGAQGGALGGGGGLSGEGGAGGEAVSDGGAGGAGAAGEGGAGGGCALCEAGAALVHRYTFDGMGTEVTDSVGSSHGAVIGGAELSGTGTLTLAGGTSDEYVDLPNGIISSLEDATFEAWITWAGGDAWQRIFDFGNSTAAEGEGTQAGSATSLFLTPQAMNSTGTLPLRTSLKLTGQAGEKVVVGASALAPSVLSQVVVVIDGTILRLYRDGAAEGLIGPVGPLSDLVDENNWLGRSQWIADAEFGGTYHDFRIYGAALSQAQIAALFAAGPDVEF